MEHSTGTAKKLSSQEGRIIDLLARALSFTGRENELPKKFRKIFSPDGVVLKHFSKKNNFKYDEVEKLARNNQFFELGTTEMIDSVIFKQPRELSVARFTDLDELKRKYRKGSARLFRDAEVSDILISRLMSIIEIEPLKGDRVQSDDGSSTVDYQRPHWTAENIFSTHLPEEYEKYRRESKEQMNIEKRFHTKLTDENNFRFGNDMMAASLMSWYQSLLISPPGIIKSHLLSGDFENWLRNSVKERELANICSNLARVLEDSEKGDIEIKREVLSRLRRTTFEGSIYNSITKPLIKKLKSADPVTVQQAAKKLMALGDERAVEGLIDKLFESNRDTRAVVIDALGVIGDPRAIGPLLKIFEHSSDESDRLSALYALKNFKDIRVIKIIKKTAGSESDDPVKKEAQKILDSLKKAEKAK